MTLKEAIIETTVLLGFMGLVIYSVDPQGFQRASDKIMTRSDFGFPNFTARFLGGKGADKGDVYLLLASLLVAGLTFQVLRARRKRTAYTTFGLTDAERAVLQNLHIPNWMGIVFERQQKDVAKQGQQDQQGQLPDEPKWAGRWNKVQGLIRQCIEPTASVIVAVLGFEAILVTAGLTMTVEVVDFFSRQASDPEDAKYRRHHTGGVIELGGGCILMSACTEAPLMVGVVGRHDGTKPVNEIKKMIPSTHHIVAMATASKGLESRHVVLENTPATDNIPNYKMLQAVAVQESMPIRLLAYALCLILQTTGRNDAVWVFKLLGSGLAIWVANDIALLVTLLAAYTGHTPPDMGGGKFLSALLAVVAYGWLDFVKAAKLVYLMCWVLIAWSVFATSIAPEEYSWLGHRSNADSIAEMLINFGLKVGKSQGLAGTRPLEGHLVVDEAQVDKRNKYIYGWVAREFPVETTPRR